MDEVRRDRRIVVDRRRARPGGGDDLLEDGRVGQMHHQPTLVPGNEGRLPVEEFSHACRSDLAEVLLEGQARPVVTAALVRGRHARVPLRCGAHVQLGGKGAVGPRAHGPVVRRLDRLRSGPVRRTVPREVVPAGGRVLRVVEPLDGHELVPKRSPGLEPSDRIRPEGVQVDAVLVRQAARLAVRADDQDDPAEQQHDRVVDRCAGLIVDQIERHVVESTAAPCAAVVHVPAVVVERVGSGST